MKCVREFTIDSSKCLPQCSGLLITSFEEQEIEPQLLKLIEYMSMKAKAYFEDISRDLKGLVLCMSIKDVPSIHFVIVLFGNG